jgi:O-antigen/teichoic acid export membrane protein
MTKSLLQRISLSPDNTLGRDYTIYFGAQSFYRITGIVILMVISRRLTEEEIGIYFFALALSEMFTILASFNLEPVLMRRVAVHPEYAGESLSYILGFRVASSLTYLLCVVIAASLLKSNLIGTIALVASFTLLENLYTVFGSLFLGLRRVLFNVAIGLIVQTFFLIIFLAGMWWAPSLGVLIGANLLRSLALLAAAVILTHRRICPITFVWRSEFIREGLPFLLVSLVGVAQGRIDSVLLGFFANYQTVGHYNLALRIIQGVAFVPAVFSQVFYPHLAAGRLNPQNRRRLSFAVGSLITGGLALMVGVFLTAPILTRWLYGGLSHQVGPLLRPLALLFPLQFLATFLTAVLQALQAEKKAASALGFSAASGLMMNAALIPLFGVQGAIIAKLLATLIQVCILAGYFRMICLRTQYTPGQ